VTGRDALADHWFPNGETFGTVDLFEVDVERIEVSGDIGYVYGRYRLRLTYGDNTSWSNEGNQLMVARRIDGEWKIDALIWNDPLATQVLTE